MLSKYAPFSAFVLVLLAVGCAGPHALRHSRAKYAAAVQVTRNEQLLLNLVRLRYRDTPSFLELTSLATQFSFDQSAGVAGTIKENSSNFNVLGLNAGLDASERPTASYTPLQGADFVTKLVSPIEEETIVLLTRSGWKGERVFRIAVQSLNGLANMRKASGPTPHKLIQAEINDATEFRYFVRNLEDYSERGIVRFNYEKVEVPKSMAISKSALTPEHAIQAAKSGFKIVHQHERISIAIGKIKSDSHIVEHYKNDELLGNLVESVKQEGLPRPIRVTHDGSKHCKNIESLGEEDDLIPFTVIDDDLLFQAAKRINEEEGSKQFKFLPCDVIDPDEVIVAGTSEKLVMTWNAENNEQIKELRAPSLRTTEEGRYALQIEPRSLMGAMFYLSHAIRVPLEHQEAGLAVMTADETGALFDWTQMTGDLLCVKCSTHRPACAAVAVKYRRYWFYIDDRDHSSKATFSLLMQLFELQAGGGAGHGPVLTLPVGI
jgi:hypothetical protein